MSKKSKILLVDDDLDFGEMAKTFLDKTGRYQVHIETMGLAALKAAKDIKPDLILLDIVMLDIDGVEVLRQLKADEEVSKIPVVFITSLMTPGEASENPIVGGHPFIAKPISGKELAQRVQKFLGK